MRTNPFPPRLLSDPLALFQAWFRQASQLDPAYANAWVLSTVDREGRPSSRVVLMKDFGPKGLVFFTNYESRKGHELDAAPRACGVFWWKELGRQVRVEGNVVRVARAASEAYFGTRPRDSQLGAWASRQSRPIKDRATLLAQMRACQARFGDGPIPCPPHWGGYYLAPRRMEFWADRPGRLHDRFEYQRGPRDRWTCRQLAP